MAGTDQPRAAWYALRRFSHDGVHYTRGRQVVGQDLARLRDWAVVGLVERRAAPPEPPVAEPAPIPGPARAPRRTRS